jgi:hypothetical protein
MVCQMIIECEFTNASDFVRERVQCHGQIFVDQFL